MTLADWRDLAVVLLALEAFVLGLVPAVLAFFSVRGMLWILRKLRAVFPPVQHFFSTAARTTDNVSQRLASPVIAVSAAAAQLRRWGSSLSSIQH